MKRMTVAVAAGAVTLTASFVGATAAAGPAMSDPWKCESCGYPFPKIPGPENVPHWGEVPGWGNLIPWGHLPEGWH